MTLIAPLAHGQTVNIEPTNGLIGFWPGNYTAEDFSPTGNNGSFGGSYVPGRSGGDAAFDLATGIVTIPNNSVYDQFQYYPGWTVGFWFNENGIQPNGNNNLFMGQDNGSGYQPKWFIDYGYTVFVAPNSNFVWHVNDYNTERIFLVSEPVSQIPNGWNQLTVVTDNVGLSVTFYLNGQQIGADGLPSYVLETTAPLLFGYAEGFTFNGLMNDVAIYNRALSSQEVTELVNSTASSTPGIYKPVGGSALTSNAATFSWVPYNGATAYWLDLGSTEGTNTYLDSGTLSSSTLSYSVTTLPTNGSTVWARWFYYANGAWSYTDYSYIAYGGIPNGDSLATMTSPISGSTFPGTNATFTWNAGVGPTAYWLDVGNAPGGHSYYSSGNLGSTQTATVNNMPLDGSVVYVTLYSQIGGIWFSNPYMYLSFDPNTGAAQMQIPTPGSTLTASSATFTWNQGTNAIAYELNVGTIPGGYDVYQSGMLAGDILSYNVNGLPTDGSTIYVTLYSLINGIWGSNAYTYTAFNATSGIAMMQSPTNGSTLSGNSVTFTWSSDANATGYWVDMSAVGPGGNDLDSSGNLGTAQTETINNLPANGSTVYVTLYSYVGGQWLSNAYTYTSNP